MEDFVKMGGEWNEEENEEHEEHGVEFISLKGKKKQNNKSDGENITGDKEPLDIEAKKKNLQKETEEKAKKYLRTNETQKNKAFSGKPNPKLKKSLQSTVKNSKIAAIEAARAEILLPTEAGYLEADEGKRTKDVTQGQIAREVDVQTTRKIFELRTNGVYGIDYSRNGRSLLIAGEKGHVVMLDWVKKQLFFEMNVKDTIRDVKFLHNDNFFATAQKKYVYIYDKSGVEIHCLKKHTEPVKLEFLPYHFLLVSGSERGDLRWQDTSIGEIVNNFRTQMGPVHAMCANPRNAVIHVGHSSGIVSLWTPSSSAAAVKINDHRGPVKNIAFDKSGNYMVTTGMSRFAHIYDIRMYKKMYDLEMPSPPSTIDVSQRGLFATSHGEIVNVWKDIFQQQPSGPKDIYMRHQVRSNHHYIKNLQFVPYEDVLGIGFAGGFASIVIPGSGEPNFDTYEVNPYETTKQRREAEVKALLDKIPANLIRLDTEIVGKVVDAVEEEEEDSKIQVDKKTTKASRKQHGKNQKNIWDQKRAAISEKEKKKRKEEDKQDTVSNDIDEEDNSDALSRFKKKKI